MADGEAGVDLDGVDRESPWIWIDGASVDVDGVERETPWIWTARSMEIPVEEKLVDDGEVAMRLVSDLI